MQFLSKAEFAKLAGLTTGNLTNYITRGKVYMGAGDLIDTKHHLNKAFLQLRKNMVADGRTKKGKEAKEAKEEKPAPEKNSAVRIFDEPGPFYQTPAQQIEGAATKAVREAAEDNEEGTLQIAIPADGSILPLDKSTTLKKHLDAVKTQKETELQDLKIQKQRGEVVPSDLLPPVFIRYNQAVISAFKQGADEITRQFAKEHDLTPEQKARMNAYIVATANESAEKAIAAALSEIETIVNNYAETRGVGERR